MIRSIRAALDTLAAALEQRAQQIRSGATLTQAVATDNLTSQLRDGIGDTGLVNETLAIAIDLTKSGLHPDEAEGLVNLRYRLRPRVLSIDDVFLRINPTMRANRAAEAAVDNATDTTRAHDDASHDYRWGHPDHPIATYEDATPPDPRRQPPPH